MGSNLKLCNFLNLQKIFCIPLLPESIRFHLGVPYYQAEIRPVEPDQVMLIRKGK